MPSSGAPLRDPSDPNNSDASITAPLETQFACQKQAEQSFASCNLELLSTQCNNVFPMDVVRVQVRVNYIWNKCSIWRF